MRYIDFFIGERRGMELAGHECDWRKTASDNYIRKEKPFTSIGVNH